MKTNLLPLADAVDGSEEVIINQGAGSAVETKRMPAALFAAAGTRPSPAELKAAILAALVEGSNIGFVDNGDGTIGVKIADNADLPGVPKAQTAAPGTNTRQLATTAFVKAAADVIAAAVAGKQGHLIEGTGVHITDNLDGTFTISATGGGGGGGGLVDGSYGDVTVSGGGTIIRVNTVTNGTVTVADEAYAAAWGGKMSVPTKNALYTKIEAVVAAINGRIAVTAVGAAGGVASLDGTGKVPAGQLPSYVDDVLEYSNTGSFPTPGETGKIYIALDTNLQWRWSGTTYVQIAASPGTTDNVPEGPTNKYYTDVRVRAAVMTGLADVVGTPAATDSLLAVLGKLRRQAFSVLGPIAGGVFAGAISTGGDATIGGNVIAAGYGDFTSPGSGTNGGIRLRAQTADDVAYLQIVNHAGSAQWGLWTYAASGAATYSGGISAANFTYTSDARLKSDIRALEGDGAAVLALKPSRYIKDGREQIGLIAQEVEEVIPEAVLTADDDIGTKSLDLGPLVAELIARVQFLDAEVARLKAAA